MMRDRNLFEAKTPKGSKYEWGLMKIVVTF